MQLLHPHRRRRQVTSVYASSTELITSTKNRTVDVADVKSFTTSEDWFIRLVAVHMSPVS